MRFCFAAYEVLSDEGKHRQYDMGGSHGHHGFNFHSKARDFHFNFDDLFKQFEDDIFGDMDINMRSHFAGHFDSHFAAHHHNTGGAFDFEDLFAEQGPDVFGFGDSIFGNNIPQPNGGGAQVWYLKRLDD